MNATFRLRRELRKTGWGCLCMAAMMGLLSLGALSDIPIGPRFIAALAMFGSVFLILAGGGVYLVLMVKRHRLSTDEASIELHGLRHSRRIAFNEIVAAVWRQSNRLKLITPTQRISIELGDYSDDDQRTLIRYFRRRLPRNIQRGWERFWSIRWKSFDLLDPADTEQAASGERTVKHGSAWIYIYVVLLLLINPLAVWMAGGPASILAAWGLIVPAVAFVWWMRKIEKKNEMQYGKLRMQLNMTQEKHISTVVGKTMVVVGMILFLIGLPLMLVCSVFDGIDKHLGLAGMFGPVLLIYLGAIIAEWKQPKHRKALNDELAQRAEELYLDGEIISQAS